MQDTVPGTEGLLSELALAGSAAHVLSDQVQQLRSQLKVQELQTLEAEAHAARQAASLQEQVDLYRSHAAKMQDERLDTMDTLTALAADNLLHDKERLELSRLRAELQLQRQELVAARAFLTEQQSNMLSAQQAAAAATTALFTDADIQVLSAHVSDIQLHRLEDLERLIKGRAMHERFAAVNRYTQNRHQASATTPQPTSIASLCSSLTEEEALLLDALATATPPPDPALQHISTLRLQLDRLQQCLATPIACLPSPSCSPATTQRLQRHPSLSPVNVCHILREQQQELLGLAHHLASQLEGAEARLATQSQAMTNMQTELQHLKVSRASLLQESQQVHEARARASAAEAALSDQQAETAAVKMKARQHIEALNKQNKVLRDQLQEQQQVLAATSHQLSAAQQELQAVEHKQAQQAAQQAKEHQVMTASLQGKDEVVQGLRDELKSCQAAAKESQQRLEVTAKKLLNVARTLEQERADRRQQEEQQGLQMEEVYQDMRQQLQTVMEAYAVELQALHDQIVRLETAQSTSAADLLAALPSSPARSSAADHQVATLQAQLMQSQQHVVELRCQVTQLTRQLSEQKDRLTVFKRYEDIPVATANTSSRAHGLGVPNRSETVASLIVTAGHVIGQLDAAAGAGSAVRPGGPAVNRAGDSRAADGHVGLAGGAAAHEQLQHVLGVLAALKAKHERLKSKYMKQQLRQHLLQQVVLQLHSSLLRVHSSTGAGEQQQEELHDVLSQAHALMSRLGLSKVQSSCGTSGTSTPSVPTHSNEPGSQTCRSSCSDGVPVVFPHGVRPGEAQSVGGAGGVQYEPSFAEAAVNGIASAGVQLNTSHTHHTASAPPAPALGGRVAGLVPSVGSHPTRAAAVHVPTTITPMGSTHQQQGGTQLRSQSHIAAAAATARGSGGGATRPAHAAVVADEEGVGEQGLDDGPLVPEEVLTWAAQYAGDEGLARPSSAVPSSMRPGSASVAVPSSTVQHAAQYQGQEGQARPSSATPSTLRNTGQTGERPVPRQVLQHVQQYQGDEGAARPSSAAPSVLRRPAYPAPTLPHPALPETDAWPPCEGTVRTGSSSSTATTQPPASLASTAQDSAYTGLGAPLYSLDAPSESVAPGEEWMEEPRVGVTPGLEYGSDSSGFDEEGAGQEGEEVQAAEEWEGQDDPAWGSSQ